MTEFIKVSTPIVGKEEVEAVREVLLSGSYVSGQRVKSFERKFAEYIGVKHAVAVSSGTAALYIALQALGVGKGDEVIVPPLTFFATISSVLYLGAMPVFADIDSDDLCLSPESVEKHISSKTRAIIPVHLFGAAAKMGDFMAISSKHGIPILEDCAQAHGTEYDGKKVGSFGAAGAFSFFATKHMTTGEGGMITTNDLSLAESAKIIRNHGMRSRDEHVLLGFNNRMTEMEAAMGLVQLKKLDTFNQARIANSEYLLERVQEFPWAVVPVPPQNLVKHTYFWCPVMVNKSSGKSIEQLKKHLILNKVGFRQRYKEPLYRQPILKHLGAVNSNVFLPNVEKVAGEIIGLPNHPKLTKGDLNRIITVLKSF
jgi:dTDP-4-amino-4,6-dideoxygalactose transaminase